MLTVLCWPDLAFQLPSWPPLVISRRAMLWTPLKGLDVQLTSPDGLLGKIPRPGWASGLQVERSWKLISSAHHMPQSRGYFCFPECPPDWRLLPLEVLCAPQSALSLVSVPLVWITEILIVTTWPVIAVASMNSLAFPWRIWALAFCVQQYGPNVALLLSRERLCTLIYMNLRSPSVSYSHRPVILFPTT